MKRACHLIIVFGVAMIAAKPCAAELLLNLGPEERVKAAGADIVVRGYSVPSLADWNNDGLDDLIIGEGSSSYPDAKICIYINEGTRSRPQFNTFSYAKYADGSDLTCPGSGCLGCFPRVVYWDADGAKDLLVGQADGKLKLFRNVGSDNDPNFDNGTFLEFGDPPSKSPLLVQLRATPCIVDWNSDGRKDLVVGSYDSKINLFINEGTDTEPVFPTVEYAVENGSDLVVPYLRSSPDILDLDGDGKKDILTGNTNGQLFFYSNKGTDSEPVFSGYAAVESDGVPIDLSASRSRPFVCDWTGDGYPDVLTGGSDGRVHLFQTYTPGDMDNDHDVEWNDFAGFALSWGGKDCGKCNGADFFDDDNIDAYDLQELAWNWLKGCD